jgi:hypothetical protein
MTNAPQQEKAGCQRRYRRREAAAYIREKYKVPCAEATLTTKACRGGGPRFSMFGRVPIYAEEDLDTWVEAELGEPVRNTSEARAARAAAKEGQNADNAELRASGSKAAKYGTELQRRSTVPPERARAEADSPVSGGKISWGRAKAAVETTADT